MAAGKIVKVYCSPYRDVQGNFGHKNTLIFQLKFSVFRLNPIHNTIYGIITHAIVRIAGVHATLAAAHSIALLSHSALYYSVNVNYIY